MTLFLRHSIDVWHCKISIRSKGVNAQGATMRACVRVASNYPFAKLMEIAESVPTGCVRQKRQATKF